MLTILEEIEIRRQREARTVCAVCLAGAGGMAAIFVAIGMWPGAVFEAALAVVFALAFRRTARRVRQLEQFR